MSAAPDEREHAVVTGAGAVSALGAGVTAFWEGVLAGRSGVAPVEELRAAGLEPFHAAAVAGYPAELGGATRGETAPGAAEPGRSEHVSPQTERAAALAAMAAREALADAGLVTPSSSSSPSPSPSPLRSPPSPAPLRALPRWGVVIGTTLGGYRAVARAVEDGRTLADVRLAGYDGPALAVAGVAGAGGPCWTVSVACCSGVAAIGEAMRLCASGACDVVLAGGADALSRFVYSGFVALKALAAGPSRPFAADRDGLNLGEGACVLVVERAGHARARGARVRARLRGYGTAGDANHMTGPHPDGLGAAAGMRAALADAGLAPEDVDAVNLHGTGTSYNDRMEARAMAHAFGARAGAVPVNSIKPCIGHTMGAAGAFEALLGALVLEHGVMPPTPHTAAVDPDCAPLDVVVGAPRPLARARIFLSTNSGFGGTNAAVVLERAGDRDQA
ncbi:MAG TPA: beta-ketoacyl synthase N-terminal-like domain-containing protein [Myxococcota bacterium]|nr:beta-ketoacyl synthase N-terminal-like domain-containing protein [Myxococcota bacterium]